MICKPIYFDICIIKPAPYVWLNAYLTMVLLQKKYKNMFTIVKPW